MAFRRYWGNLSLVEDFLSALSQPRARRPKKGQQIRNKSRRKTPYYAGWNIVWAISHGSVRTLLELVEYIFRTNRASSDTSGIPLKDQDKAVRSYSTQKFKSLQMLPADFDKEPLGPKLQNVMSAIGEISRQYLQHYDTGSENRWHETISIERLDRHEMNPKAERILNELVKYGLLLDEGVTFSRAQLGLSQRYDMNKIFAPAFETTYRVRNHMYLSKERIEDLLLTPDIFVERQRKKLERLVESKESPLFGDESE